MMHVGVLGPQRIVGPWEKVKLSSGDAVGGCCVTCWLQAMLMLGWENIACICSGTYSNRSIQTVGMAK
jgi:hypothetical protein